MLITVIFPELPILIFMFAFEIIFVLLERLVCILSIRTVYVRAIVVLDWLISFKRSLLMVNGEWI